MPTDKEDESWTCEGRQKATYKRNDTLVEHYAWIQGWKLSSFVFSFCWLFYVTCVINLEIGGSNSSAGEKNTLLKVWTHGYIVKLIPGLILGLLLRFY